MKMDRAFVIQKHTKASRIHWDLKLEAVSIFETYRLEMPPEKLLQQADTAGKIFDHLLKFLTYEGSVNKGKGSVEIAETGTCQLLSESKNRQELQLDGKILKGKFILTHIENNSWEFGQY